MTEKDSQRNPKVPNIPMPPGLKMPQLPSIPGLGPKMDPKAMEKARKELAEKIKATLDKIKKEAEPVKKELVKKYKNEIVGISLLPPREKGSKKIDILALITIEGDFKKKIAKVKEVEKLGRELVAKKVKDATFSAMLLDELWDACNKGKYDLLQMIAMAMNIYDPKEWMAMLKALELHKMQILRKFEKYVISYVLVGSFVRGDVKPESDVDVYIVIDDTDVTRMTSAELRQKLMGMIWGYAENATMEAGTKIKLHPQVYVLTDMWDSLKAAQPVIFTMLRDGVPLYDRGLFAPWKMLLKSGKIVPTPEAINQYMRSGKSFIERTKRKLREMAMEEFFLATITPTQGALMLLGLPPADPKQAIKLFKEHFVDKGLIEKKYADILEYNLKIRKDIEHGKIKEIDPKIITKQLKESEAFIKRLDKLMETVEKEAVEREINDLYEKALDDGVAALNMIGTTANAANLLKKTEEALVKKKLAPSRYLQALKRIWELKKTMEGDRRELASLLFEQERQVKDVFNLIRAQGGKDVTRFKVGATYNKNKRADVWLLDKAAFIVMDVTKPDTKIYKFAVKPNGALENQKASNLGELEKTLKVYKGAPTKITKSTLSSLKKVLADDVDLIVGA